jgi:VanZ family protein
MGGKVKQKWAVLTAGWVLVIFFSSTSLAARWCESAFSSISAWLMPAAAHEPSELLHVIADKGLHVALFFVLALLLWNTVTAGGRVRFAVILAAGLVVGSLSEYLQSLFPDRDPALRDVLINLAGVAAGAAMCLAASSSHRVRRAELTLDR